MDSGVRSGPASVLAHGMVTSFFGHPLSITSAEPEGRVWVILRFHDDPASPEPTVQTTTVEGGLELDLTNFDEGRGSAQPVLLG